MYLAWTTSVSTKRLVNAKPAVKNGMPKKFLPLCSPTSPLLSFDWRQQQHHEGSKHAHHAQEKHVIKKRQHLFGMLMQQKDVQQKEEQRFEHHLSTLNLLFVDGPNSLTLRLVDDVVVVVVGPPDRLEDAKPPVTEPPPERLAKLLAKPVNLVRSIFSEGDLGTFGR